MRIEPEIDEVVVVLVGDFNPAVFTPAWFVLHGLLPANAADDAEVEVVHPRTTVFSFDWLRLQITEERFVAGTARAPRIRVRDFVARTFTERPNHTPLRELGINRGVHFPVGSRVEMDRIGRILAPVEPWGAWGRDLEPDGKHGGMTSLRMSQVKIEGRPPEDRINVTVEPSNPIVGRGRAGVYVAVNDHYTTGDTGSGSNERLMEILEDSFETSLERGDGIVDHVMSLAEE